MNTTHVALAALLAGSVLTGCTTGASDTPTPTMVTVRLQEWAILADPGTAPAGDVTFAVSNRGPKALHELVLVKTDFGPGALPTTSEGRVDEDADGVEVIGEIEDVAVGATDEATFALEPGTYLLICNISDKTSGKTHLHYALGMRAAFTVTGS